MDRKKKKRSAIINVRVQSQEKLDISVEASVAGLTVSEYVRRLTLGRQILAATDLTVINELRRLGGLVKFLYTQGAPAEVTASALRDLQAYIKRLDRDR